MKISLRMSFLVGQTVVVTVDVVFGLTLNDQPHTREDEDGSECLRALEHS